MLDYHICTGDLSSAHLQSRIGAVMKAAVFGLGLLLAAIQPAEAAFLVTTNVSGYREFSAGERPFTQVSGCWQSPTVNAQTLGGSFTPQIAVWVGINGETSIDGTLIQAGAIYSVNQTTGVLDYEGFYELLPGNIQLISPVTYPIIPGDIMCPNINCTSNCSASNASTTFDTRIDNCGLVKPLAGAMTCPSPKWSYTRTDTYATAMRNADWIVESLSHSGTPYPYPVYGCIPFTNMWFNGHPASISYSTDSIQMDQVSTGATSNPSNPSSTGDGFSTCWGTGGVQTTPPTGDPVYLPGLGGKKF